jgi:hypothetical protein
MKIIITERQLNELMSLENYDAVTFISNKLIGELNNLIAQQIPQEKELINILTNVIVNSIIEFYELEDSEGNRKKINSLFHLYLNIMQRLQLHINNKKRDFDSIAYDDKIVYDDKIKTMVGKLVEVLGKRYPDWVEAGEFKKEKILPYKNTPFQSDDELSVGIYDWNTTFDTLEKLFYDFLFENLEDVEYEKYKTIIDSNMDRFKDYVEKNDYKKHIYYDKPISDKMGKRMIKVLDQDKIYDKKYISEYIYSLHDIGIEKKLFDKDFIKFLVMFRGFVTRF